MLYNALHIGDQLLSVAGLSVVTAADAHRFIRASNSLYVSYVRLTWSIVMSGCLYFTICGFSFKFRYRSSSEEYLLDTSSHSGEMLRASL